MPIFEFQCNACGKNFEEICSPEEISPCIFCGSTDVIKVVSMPSPLKTGAFPFKPGPVHPLASRMATGSGDSCHTCPGKSACEKS